jgi:hypothetical protein
MISLADKLEIRAKHSGEVVLPFENAKFRLTDVYFVPDLGFNLVSVVLRTKESRRHFKRHALHSKFLSLDSRLDAVFVVRIPGFTVCWHLKGMKLCLLYLLKLELYYSINVLHTSTCAASHKYIIMRKVFRSLGIRRTFAVLAVSEKRTNCPSRPVFVARTAPVS